MPRLLAHGRRARVPAEQEDRPITAQERTESDEAVGRELRGAARGGAVTFVGSFFSTAMGFVLALVLARQLGAAGSGLVLQMIAAFMIALSLTRLGMDTTGVWLIPRIVTESPRELRGVCVGLVASSAAAALVTMVLWWLVVGLGLVPAFDDAAVVDLIDASLWVLPVGAVMFVALAATRGLGGVLPFNLVQNILVPGLRPVLVLAVTLAGGGVAAAAGAWAVPFLLGMVLALAVLVRRVRRFEQRHGAGAWRPTRGSLRRMMGFALPRTWAAGLEQSIIWMDVILVGILAGAAAAGVYGAASRFVGAGVVVLTAFRIVVAPRFSAMLAQHRIGELQRFYVVTATWILLFGAPIYVLLAFFSPTVLSWLGPDFDEGVRSMVILCTGALVLLAGGNVQSLLLMSGHSGWGAFNKSAVFVTNLVGNIVLVPRLGIEGAAITWAVCMSLDTTLATFQVHRFTSIRPALRRILATLLAVAACVAAPSGAVLALRGNDTVGLLAAGSASLLLLAGYAYADRRRLHFDELVAASRARRRAGAAGGQSQGAVTAEPESSSSSLPRSSA